MNARRIDGRDATEAPRGRRRGAAAAARASALIAIAGTAALAGCRIEATPAVRGSPAQEAAAFHAEVSEILGESARSWNAGDLDGFMDHYERAPTTTYIGATGLIEGWDAIRARYEPAFEPGAERDSLRFTDLRTRPLGQRFGLATARYVLERGGETTASGPFTLVLTRVDGAWKIIHDQSASDPPPGAGGSG